MKVILKADVKGQGKKGQLVDVSDGYARNFLLPRNLAVEANTQNMGELKAKEAAQQRRIELEKAAAREMAAKLKGVSVKVTAKGNASYKAASKTVTVKVKVK